MGEYASVESFQALKRLRTAMCRRYAWWRPAISIRLTDLTWPKSSGKWKMQG